MNDTCCKNNQDKKCCSKGLCCPLTGFKFGFNKKFVIGFILMAVWLNIFSWFWHGKMMTEIYASTANLWRPEAEMRGDLIGLGLLVSAFFSTFIFMKGYEGTGMREGIRFGIIIAFLFLGSTIIAYATQPIPKTVITLWFLGDLLAYIIGGVFLGFVFEGLKKTSCCNK